MKAQGNLMRRRAMLVFAMALLTTVLTASALTSGTMPVASPRQRQDATELPAVLSKLKNLKVTKVSVSKKGSPNATVSLEVRNNSPLAVTAFIIEFGDLSVTTDGGLTSDIANTVIEPYGTVTVPISLNNLSKDVPIVVSGVVYADGTEDGLALH